MSNALSVLGSLVRAVISVVEYIRKKRKDKENARPKNRVEATGITEGKEHFVRIANTGSSVAKNVRYELNEEVNCLLAMHDREPFPLLESGKSYDERIHMFLQTSARTFSVYTFWEDAKGKEHRSESVVTF